MYDIESHINKISGQQNYMDSLSQITGDAMSVDIEYWMEKNRRITAANKNIKTLLSNIVMQEGEENLPDEFINLKNNFDELWTSYNLQKSFKIKNKKTGYKVINDGYHPLDILKSEWFELIKKLEKAINDYVADVIGENVSEDSPVRKTLTMTAKSKDIDAIVSIQYTVISAINAKHPEFLDLKKIFGVSIKNTVLKSFLYILQFSNLIINLMMYPMYDVSDKIRKNSDKLEKIFKNGSTQQMLKKSIGTSTLPMEEVLTMLEKFIVAKYRSTVTGNSDHFMKLFLDVVGNNDVSEIDGARFMEIMESLDLDQLETKENVYKFATGAKDIMKKVLNGEKLNAENIIGEVKSLFESSEKNITPEQTEALKNNENDIL